MNSRPKPRDLRALLKRFAELHFKGMAPGGQGRKRNLGDACAFLTFAVNKPGDLTALLDQMEADGGHDLRLATGLIALFGLRPAELAVLTVIRRISG